MQEVLSGKVQGDGSYLVDTDSGCYMIDSSQVRTLSDARRSGEWEGPSGWKAAVQDQLDQIKKHGVVVVRNAASIALARRLFGDQKVEIKSMLFIAKVKRDAQGNETRKKVRAPVADGRAIFCRIPKGLEEFAFPSTDKEGKQLYWEVVGNMPGRQEAGKTWFQEYREFICSIGFKESLGERCICFRHDDEGRVCVVGVYVDDTWTVSNSPSISAELDEALEKRFKYAPDVAQTAGDFVAAHVQQVEDNTVEVGCPKLLGDLKRMGTPISDSNPVLESGWLTTAQSIIGLASFIACNFRPDAFFAFVCISQFLANKFTKAAWNTMLRWAHYLVAWVIPVMSKMPPLMTMERMTVTILLFES